MSRVSAGRTRWALARSGAAGLAVAVAFWAGTAQTTAGGTAGPTWALAGYALLEPDDPADPDPEETEPATPTPTPTTPDDTPTISPPTTEPETPTPTPTPTPTTAPATSAPTTAPTTSAPGQAGPVVPGKPRLGAHVSTGDILLTNAYWDGRDTVADLEVTVTNTGDGRQFMQLRYRLPAGLADGGTRGCAITVDGHVCGAWTAEAGARWTTKIRVRIAADAWRLMPLGGSVQITATAPAHPDLPAVSDDEGFAVLFPPGPPVTGLTLDAGEVNFDISGQPTALDVRLGNTSDTDSTGTVEILLPEGVTLPIPPPNCRQADPTRTWCDLGEVPAGQIGTLRLTVAATPEAQKLTPLSGALIGIIDPVVGPTKRMQMSFRVVAAAAASTPPPVLDAAGPTGSQGVLPPHNVIGQGDPLTSVQKTAIALISASILLVVLALVLATTSLRRRLRPEEAETGR